MITINTILDMRPGAVPKIIHLSQYDSDFSLVFRLHASFGTLNIESGTTAEIRGTKKSGTGYSASATLNTTNNTVTVAGDAQMTAVAGQNIYEIVLIKNNKVLGSANFILLVERAALDADTITDASVLRNLEAIVEGAETATQAAEDAEDAADRAEAAVQLIGNAVTYTAQSKTVVEKAQARSNIRAQEVLGVEYSENLFDSEDVTPNKFFYSTDAITTQLRDREGYFASGLIDVSGCTKITISGAEVVSRHRENQATITPSIQPQSSLITPITYTLDDSVKYIRVAGKIENINYISVRKPEFTISDLKLTSEQTPVTAVNKSTITDDLDITDENGHVIVSFTDGHIKTKNFDSSDIETETTVDAEELPVGDDLNIVDDDYYSIVTLSDGHIKTKNFDSREALTLANTRYYGAKISVLGDSISSFNGFSPSTWNPYYPTYGPDVNSVSKMWFSIVADAIGGSVLASASWGASGVCGNSEDSTGNVGSSSARIAALAPNSVNPDIIFIEMGTNDWSSNRTIGGFDENSELPANGTITDFSQAYAKMLSRIMSTYPLAAVFCMTISARLTNADSTFPVKNSNGITIPAFNAEIRKIANIFGAKVININSCGISVYNLSTYAGEHQLHPNAAGHVLMAKEVISELLK